jgi:hypothetical protein
MLMRPLRVSFYTGYSGEYACSLHSAPGLYEIHSTRHPRMSLAGVQLFEKTWIPATSTRE